MKAFVTGGTGFIGGHIVDRLVADGIEVRCLARKTSNTKHLKEQGVEIFVGDISDRESLSKALDDIDVVYHLGAVAGVKSIPPKVYWKTNVEGTQNLLDAALSSDIKKFVHCSTVGVIGWPAEASASESTPYSPIGVYHKTKYEAEKIALKYYTDNGLPVTIVRPGLTYGPRDTWGFVYKLARLLKKKFFAYIGSGENLLHLSHVSNIVDGMTLAAENNKSSGETYILVDESPTRLSNIVQIICGVFGIQAPWVHVPVPFAKAVGMLFEPLSYLGVDPFITRYKVDVLTKSRSYTINKARRELGYAPRITTDDGIRLTVGWYTENGLM